MRATLAFILDNARWLAAGFVLALASSFGQTYFISLFAADIRAEFGLSHGDWGLIYMIGTLASAGMLIAFGGLADTLAARRAAVFGVLALAAACAGMAVAPHWLALPVAVFALRLFGQGAMSHLSTTLTARWFVATRGRALAVTNAGFPTGEAIAPVLVVALIAAFGWRGAYAACAVIAACALAPALWALLLRERTPRAAAGEAQADADAPGRDGRSWTRAEALRDPLFWALAPGLLAPGWILTVVFFLPDHIAETKGWTLSAVAGSYWAYALASVLAAAVSGVLIDRFSARAGLALYQAPMAGGLLALAHLDDPNFAPIAYAGFGLTAGAAVTLVSALWVELYGARHLGAIKAAAVGGMVVATAAGPGVAGALIDAGADIERQAIWMAGYTVAVSALAAVLLARGRLGPGVFGRDAAQSS